MATKTKKRAKTYKVEIDVALGWELDKGECLSWALTDAAEKELDVVHKLGTISVKIKGKFFVMTFEPV